MIYFSNGFSVVRTFLDSFAFLIEWFQFIRLPLVVTGILITLDLISQKFSCETLRVLIPKNAAGTCRYHGLHSSASTGPINLPLQSLGIRLVAIFILCWMPVSNSAPTLSAISTGNQPTNGGTIISVSGSGFVLYSTISSLGDTAAQNTLWISTSAILCNVGYGIGGSIHFNLLINNFDPVSITQAVTFDDPSMSSISMPNILGGKFLSITVTGSSFGFTDFSPIERAGQTGLVSTLWSAETSVSCKASHGFSQSIRFMISFGGAGATITDATSYDIGAISIVAGGNLGEADSSFRTLFGSRFGTARYLI